MRELLELATEKYYVKQMKIYEKFKKLKEIGIVPLKSQFDEEVSEF